MRREKRNYSVEFKQKVVELTYAVTGKQIYTVFGKLRMY